MKKYGIVAEFAGQLMVRYHLTDPNLRDSFKSRLELHKVKYVELYTNKGNYEFEIITTSSMIQILKLATLSNRIRKIQMQINAIEQDLFS